MILRNASFSLAGSMLSTLLALAITPRIVRYLGQDAYGVWNILVSLAGTCNILDLGLAPALNTTLATLRATGRENEARQTLSSALTMYCLVAVLVLVFFAGVHYGGFYRDKVPTQALGAYHWALLLMAVVTAMGFPMRVYEAILVSKEYHYQVYSAEALADLGRLGLMMALLPLGGGLLTMGQIQFWVGLTVFACLFIFSRKLWPLGRLPRPGWNKERAFGLMKYGLDMCLVTMGNTALQQAPILLLGVLLNPAQVAIYVLGGRLLAQERTVIDAGVGVVQPRYAALVAKSAHDEARALLLRAGLYASLLGSFIGLGVLILARPFYQLWMGPAFARSATVALVLIGPMSVYMCLRPCEVLLYGIGRHRVIGWVNLAEVSLVLCLAWPLVRAFGMEAMAGLVGASMLCIRPLVIPAFACRQVGLRPGTYWRQGPWRAARTCLLAALPLAALFSQWRVHTWLGLFLAVLVYGIIWLPCAVLAGLDTAERRFWRERLASLKILARFRGGD